MPGRRGAVRLAVPLARADVLHPYRFLAHPTPPTRNGVLTFHQPHFRYRAELGMIDAVSIEVVYTAESTATGGGRDGHVKSTDQKIDLDTRPPKEMGGSGEGVNPELLFSAGWSACFLGALRLVARNEKISIDDASGITAQIGFGKDSEGGFGLTADLIGYLPGLEQDAADDLMAKAHEVCPYSKATRGNIDVSLSAKV